MSPFTPSRPGHFHWQIVQTSSLTFHEEVGAEEVVAEADEGAGDEVIADSITVKPRIIRTLPPNAKRRRQDRLQTLTVGAWTSIIKYLWYGLAFLSRQSLAGVRMRYSGRAEEDGVPSIWNEEGYR
jgi:hypothetical protein